MYKKKSEVTNMRLDLEKIEIKNFYSYKDASYENFKNYNVIIGRNNSGKSNLFKIFNLLKKNAHAIDIKINDLFDENLELDNQIILNFSINQKLRTDIFSILFDGNYLSKMIEYYLNIPNKYEDDQPIPEWKNKNETIEWLLGHGLFNNLSIDIEYDKSQKFLCIRRISVYHRLYNTHQTLFELQYEMDRNEPYILNLDKFVEFSRSIEGLFRLKELKKLDYNTTFTLERIITLGRNEKVLKKSIPILNPILNSLLDDFFDVIHIIPAKRIFDADSDRDDLRNTYLDLNGKNLVKFIHKKAVRQEWEWLKEWNMDLKQFLENFEVLKQDLKDNEKSTLILKENGLNMDLTLESMGSGILNIAHFLAYLKTLENPSIICIEEPELFIFPGLQKKLREKLLSFSNNNQVFITTHSPNFMTRNFKKSSIHNVKKIENYSSINSISNENLLDVFKELDLTFYDYILYDGILFVEGSKDMEVFKVINEEIFENNLKIIPIEGKNNFIHYASANIVKFLDNNTFHFLFIMDRDRGNTDFYKRINDKKIKDLIKERIITLFTYEIENLFLQPLLLLDYIYCNNKTKTIKEDFKWILNSLEETFKLNGLNNFKFILKKLNDIMNLRLSKQDIEDLTNTYESLPVSSDLPNFICGKIDILMKKKLNYIDNPIVNREKLTNEIYNTQTDYDNLLSERKYNLLFSGKKTLRRFSDEIIKKYHLSVFSLETLTRHLITFLIDFNNYILEKKYSEDEYEHSLLDDYMITKFVDYIENVIILMDQIKIKTKSESSIQIAVKDIKKSILIQFIIKRWNLSN